MNIIEGSHGVVAEELSCKTHQNRGITSHVNIVVNISIFGLIQHDLHLSLTPYGADTNLNDPRNFSNRRESSADKNAI